LIVATKANVKFIGKTAIGVEHLKRHVNQKIGSGLPWLQLPAEILETLLITRGLKI